MPDAAQQTSNLFQHAKRTEWGFAIMAWERDGKRGYQFEDGELRVFKEGYYGLLKEMQDVVDSKAIIARLDAKRSSTKNADKRKKGARGSRNDSGAENLPTLGEQILVFQTLYPRGFDDPQWIKDQRGGDGRALKRHRGPAIKRAQDGLAKDSIEALINAGSAHSVIERACDVLDKTDLVTKSQVDPLRDTGRDSRLADALLDFLYGETDLETRFANLCRTLATASRKPPSWQLATAFGALVHPANHVCIRPSVFAAQARTMAPRLRASKAPTPSAYAGYVEMALAIEVQLGKAGFEPRDLLDVHDFIWVTLRPAAVEVLEGIRKAGSASEGDEGGDEAPAPASKKAAGKKKSDADDDDADAPAADADADEDDEDDEDEDEAANG